MDKLKIILIILVSGYVIASLILYLVQEKLIFQGDGLPSDYVFSFEQSFEEGNLTMKDGATINYLLFKAPENKRKGLIVLEEDIVPRLVFLDKIILQQKGIKFRA